MRFGKPRSDQDDPGHAIFSAPPSDDYYASSATMASPHETTSVSSPRSSDGGVMHSPVNNNKRNPFRWAKGRKNAPAGEEASSQPRCERIDPLLVEIDVSASSDCSSSSSRSPCSHCSSGGAVLTDNPASATLADEFAVEDLRKMPLSDDVVEETEALTLSFGSGMCLSADNSHPHVRNVDHDGIEDNDMMVCSPQRSNNNRSSSKLRFPLQDQFSKRGFTSLPQERPSSASPRRWSRKLAEVASPRRTSFQRVDSGGAHDFQIMLQKDDHGDEALLHSNENNNISGLPIAFPGLETEGNHARDTVEQTVSTEEAGDEKEASNHSADGIEEEESMPQNTEDSSPSEQFYYPPPPIQETVGNDLDDEQNKTFDETRDKDIVLDGLSHLLESPRKREPLLSYDRGESSSPLPIGENEDTSSDPMPSATTVQSPTKMRAALNRLGKLKKKVAKKLKKPETTDNGFWPEEEEEATDDAPATSKDKAKSNWAEKITKIAANSAKSVQMVANSVQPLSPLKARKGRKLERLDSLEESEGFVIPSINLSETEASTEEPYILPAPSLLGARDEFTLFDNSFEDAVVSFQKNPALDSNISSDLGDVTNHEDCDKEHDNYGDSDTDSSVDYESNAPAGTVWIRSTSGCIQHLEINFDDMSPAKDVMPPEDMYTRRFL